MAVGKKAPSAIVAIFEGSPMPNQRMKSGSIAILGIGKSAAITGMPTDRAMLEMPIASPATMPAEAPSDQPIRSRRRLAWMSISEIARARQIDQGVGDLQGARERQVADESQRTRQPARRVTSPIRVSGPTCRSVRGAKPRPRKATSSLSPRALAIAALP